MAISIDQLHTAIWIYDIDEFRIHWSNPAGLKLWESDSLEELQSRDFLDGSSDAVRTSLSTYQQAFLQGETLSEVWTITPKGIAKEIFLVMSGYRLKNGRMAMCCEAVEPKSMGHSGLFNSKMLMSSYQFDGQFISSNPSFREEISSNQINLDQLISDKQQLQKVYDDLNVKNHFEGDVLCNSHDNQRWYQVTMHLLQSNTDKQGKILLYQHSIHDRKTKEVVQYQEFYQDALTGLLNRRGLLEQLNSYCTSNTPFLLYYIDLDGFKLINDSYGHAGGDSILKWFADNLANFNSVDLGSAGNACRFGGDEFIFVCPLDRLLMSVETLSEKLLATLSRTYDGELGISMDIFASIGRALYPQDGETTADIISSADSAMYISKLKGKNQITTYLSGMELESKRKGLLAQHLSHAIKRQELSVQYQAIYDVKGNRLDSYEALLCWSNKILGNVSTRETLQVAKSVGLIQVIEGWVIDRALQDLPSLRERANDNVRLSLNISGLHLTSDNFIGILTKKIQQAGLKPQDIIIELTETTLLNDIEKQISLVNLLKDLGVFISIDSFGIGLSSLAYLHKIPADIVKIDKQFLKSLMNDSRTIEYIHQLVVSLGMTTLIEGVENREQQKALVQIGIQLQQGSFYNK